MTAKLNSYQKSVRSAVAAYAKGSERLVRLFEQAATRYWNEDSRTVDNFSFFLNELKAFPVLQKAAVESARSFGKFNIDIKDGAVLIENKGKVSDEQRTRYIETIEAYIAKQYNSLLAAHQNKLLKAFDFDQRVKGFKKAAADIVVNAVAEEKCTKEQAIQRLKDALAELETMNFDEQVDARKAEIEASKITGEQIADAVANAESVAEDATAA